MNLRNSKLSITGPEADFARLARAIVAGVLVAGILLVAACGDGMPQAVSQAIAAPAESTVSYFPSQFPSVYGEPVEPIQGF